MIDRRTEEVIERMGLFFEQDGLPRIAGRVLGYLLLCPEPRSLDGLAEALQVSKSSVSTDARLLERRGVLERVTLPGDRRDYYRIAPDLPKRVAGMWRERLTGTRDLLEDALATPAAGVDEVRRRLRRGSQLMDRLATSLDEAMGQLGDEGGGVSRAGSGSAEVV